MNSWTAIRPSLAAFRAILGPIDRRSYQAFYPSEFDRWGQYIRTAKITFE